MSNPAALPGLAIVVGLAVGSVCPIPALLLVALLALGSSLAVVCFRSGYGRGTACALVAGFLAVGGLLGRDAVERAERSSLRRVFDRHAGDLGRSPDPVVVEGRLRRDAAPTDYGVSLTLAVERIRVGHVSRAVQGGVSLSVGGELWRGRVGEWTAGRRLRVPATLRLPMRYLNPGSAGQERALAVRGLTLLGSVKSGALVEILERGGAATEAAAGLRAAVRRAIDASVGVWSSASAGIVTAILIGDRTGLPADAADRLREAGTFHVIAISGGNVAILAGLLLGLLRLLGTPPRAAAGVAIVGLSGYAFVVGGEASVVRATLVGVVYLSARLLDHRTPPLNAVALAAVVGLSARPLSVFDVGFALTFGATLAILLGAQPTIEWLSSRLAAAGVSRTESSWVRVPLGLFSATLCAEIALFPIGAYAFSRVSFAGLVLNFAAIPLMTLAQVAGLAVLGLTVVHAGLARAVGYVSHLAAVGLVESARLVELAPWSTLRVPPPGVVPLCVYYGAWVVWLLLRPRTAGRRLAGSAAFAAGAWMLAAPGFSPPPLAPAGGDADWLRVTVLDVGQGDAVLVTAPGGRSMLVDAGGTRGGGFDVGGRVVAPAVWALGLRRLDVLALTHGDPDHIGGALSLLRDLQPSEVWEGVPVPTHGPMRAVAERARSLGAGWRQLHEGQRLPLGAAQLRVWHPPTPTWERPRVRNDDSLVLEVRIGTVSFLLPGDIGHEVEAALAARAHEPRLWIVKMPHHGSAGSSSPRFVEALRPVVAISSAGRGNAYGHPAAEVVERYRRVGAAVFRTDHDGAIRVDTDGREVWVETMRGKRLHITPRLP